MGRRRVHPADAADRHAAVGTKISSTSGPASARCRCADAVFGVYSEPHFRHRDRVLILRQLRTGGHGMARTNGRGIARAVVTLGLLLVPIAAHAQSTLTGVVKDVTGAVLPGVTVEAASPVLIEKTRSVITDGSGGYRIVDLRPGVYTLTFTLPGFTSYKREALELPANFTMTVNAELRVGGVEETVLVAGLSPTVDVQTTT